MWKVIVLIITFWGFQSNRSQFLHCHDDSGLTPEEGPLDDIQYTWLGTLQYIHIKNGTPHYFRVPRVVLIARQFVISTAVDASQVPDGYALGNVVFGEYERDELECRLTVQAVLAGKECEVASLLVPLSDVLLHPEYKHFGATESIALLKLLIAIKSEYMVPACLPFNNFLRSENGKQTRSSFYHIDFTNDVPRDPLAEDKEITKLNLLPQELCHLYSVPVNTTSKNDRIICTTSCGFHSGAPSVVQEHTGHWSIVFLSLGGSPCPDPLRTHRPPPPPRHIQIHPYVPWITSAITGKAVGAFDENDPFGYKRALDYETFEHDWVGHWWMGGLACYNRGESADNMFKFYHEIFQVKPVGKTMLTYYLEISATHGTSIICVKVGMPYRYAVPKVWNLDTPEVKVRIPVLQFSAVFKFQVEAWAYNVTTTDDLGDSTSSMSSSEEYH